MRAEKLKDRLLAKQHFKRDSVDGVPQKLQHFRIEAFPFQRFDLVVKLRLPVADVREVLR